MMKYIIFILSMFMSVSAFAQDDFPVKTDGTKYYLQMYDGETNEKVVYYNAAGPAWNTLIHVADYFDGSDVQLWSFEESPNFPGYFLVRNRDESVFSTHSLMSWSWNAYLATDESRPPLNEMEKQFRFVEAFDGYYILETIEKPTDGSLYDQPYTPGADAMNVQDGIVSFRGVKSADITRENMANSVFKIVEFNPIALFEESILRGEELYNNNPDAPEQVRLDMFYELEKAREVRVFGTNADILAYQPKLDEVLASFNQVLDLQTIIIDARAFIDTAAVSENVKNSFLAILDKADEYMNSDSLDYTEIDSIIAQIQSAQSLVEAIIAAQTYGESLVGQDSMLITGLNVSIVNAETVLANDTSNVDEYSEAIAHLNNTQAIIDEVIIANDLIANTQDFEEAKSELTAAVDVAIGIINTAGTTAAELEQAMGDLQEAIKAFQRALEAGDTPIELINADFEDGLADWNVESPTPGAAYPENKGVDGSRSITFWRGSDYQMKVFQSISSIPNGTYLVSCYANVNTDNSIALFAESGENSTVFPIANEGGLVKRTIEVEVTNGMLQFGIKGAGENNAIPGGNWIVFDEFEVKLSSKIAVSNADFEADLTDWLVEGVTAAAYPENKGVDGSRSITCWRGSDYNISVSQLISGLSNGFYTVSAMAKTNLDSAFVVFGESGGVVMSEPVTGNQLSKIKTIIEVTDGTAKVGVKGAGEDNAVPAGKWIVFDNVEVVRMPDVPIINPGFEEEFAGWTSDASAGVPYLENKGVDGSRSVTYWKGADYNAVTYQNLTGLANGSYEISAMTNVPVPAEDLFTLFGESGGQAYNGLIKSLGGLGKSKVLAKVTDGSLSFGMKGSGENNSIPAGRWIVYDDFEIKIKSITPVYEVFEPTPAQMLVTNNETQRIGDMVTYWQANQRLNIRSTDAIVKYSVYSVTGSMIEQKVTKDNALSIPMRSGIYIVRVFTENGLVDTKKVSIR